MSISFYVLRTVPTHRIEFEVRHALNQREHPAFVPFEEKLVRNARTKRLDPRKYPLFPCYVFAGFSSHLDYVAARTAINMRAEQMGKKPPIVGAVGFGNKPSIVSPSDIAMIETLSVENPTEVNLHKALKIGTDVMVLEGPWRDRVGKLSKADRKRIVVMLELFGSMLPVEMPATTSIRAA